MSRRSVVLLLALAACGVPERKLPPLERTVRAVSPSFLEDSIAARRVSGVTLRIYNTGAVETRGGAVSSERNWSSHVRLDDPVFLVRHPDQGAVLFDAGLTTATAAALTGTLMRFVARFESAPGQDAASQLKADGVAPGDVRWIILSHLHLDHVGDLAAFPNATVVVSRREWEDQGKRARGKRDPRRFDPAAWEGRIRLRLVDFEGEKPYGAFDHGLDLFSDGTVVLVPLPGHTAGSMGAWVNLDGGPVLLAGDAAWVVDNLMDEALPYSGAMAEPSDYRRSIETIRAMQEAAPRLVVFPGHDLTPRKLSTRDDLPLVDFPRSGP